MLKDEKGTGRNLFFVLCSLFLVLIAAALILYPIYMDSSRFGDNLYNLAVVLHSAMPQSQHFLETMCTYTFFKPLPITRAEDWHRDLPMIVLRCLARWTQAQDGALLRTPHLLWTLLWLWAALRLLRTLGRERWPGCYRARAGLAAYAPWLLVFLLIANRWGYTLLRNPYVDDVPAGALALLALSHLAVDPMNRPRVLRSSAIFMLSFAGKDFYLVWAPLSVGILFIYYLTARPRVSLQWIAVTLGLYTLVYLVACVPKLAWNYYDLGQLLSGISPNTIRNMYFGVPEKSPQYPFYLYGDDSYTSPFKLRGGLLPVIKRIFEWPLPETLTALLVLSMAWWWLIPYAATRRSGPPGPSRRFLVHTLPLCVAFYVVFFSFGLAEGMHLRFWIVPVTLAFVLGVHGVEAMLYAPRARRASARLRSVRPRKIAMAAFGLAAAGLLWNPYAGRSHLTDYSMDPAAAEAIARYVRPGEALLSNVPEGASFVARYPDRNVVANVPQHLMDLDDDKLNRFLSDHRIKGIFFPYDPDVAGRMTWWRFAFKGHFGDFMLLARATRGDKQPGSSYTFVALERAGARLEQQGRTDEALAFYNAMVKDDPRNVQARLALANLLVRQSKMEEAVAQYREILAIDPINRDAWFNLGAVLLASGKTEEAATSYREAFALDPTDAVVACELGRLAAAQERWDDAAMYYREALKFDPANVAARAGLETALHRRKSPPLSR